MNNTLGLSTKLSAIRLGLVVFASVAISHAEPLDHWHWRNPAPFADSLRSSCYGAGKFVAVGDGGVIHTSLDGLAWDEGRRPVTSTLWKIIYANGQFVAVGDVGTVVTSPDGYAWTSRSSGVLNTLYSVAYGNGKYIASGAAGSLAISADGAVWAPGSVGAIDLPWITFGNGVFVVPAPNQFAGQQVEVSTDGQTWTTTSFPTANSFLGQAALHEATFANGRFVACAEDGNTGIGAIPIFRFFTSNDGTNWLQGAFIYGVSGYNSTHLFLAADNGTFYEASSRGLAVTADGSATFVAPI